MNENTYLITGANSDIGLHLISHLLANGKTVVATCRKTNVELETLRQKNDTFSLLETIDLENHEDLDRLKNYLLFNLNEKKIKAVHCVGNFWFHKTITSTSFVEASEMIRSHYLTAYNLSKILIPIMKSRKFGRILTFSCNSVIYNYPDMAAFTSAKAAVETLTKCLANENSEFNIAINTLALSTIKTKKVIDSKKLKYHNSYLSLDELTEIIIHTIDGPDFINGNIFKVLKHSKYFYNEGYYDRNIILDE